MIDDPESSEPKFALVRNGLLHDIAKWMSPRPERLFTSSPRVAVVVGTFAAVPYVHLHLEARRRFYPGVPLLVQDDCSPFEKPLSELCDHYGAEFGRNVFRFPRFRGDMTAMAHGLVWARKQNADLLVKMSRRFIPITEWVSGLQALAMESQYATYSEWNSAINYGFRTDCVGFAVEEWHRLGLLDTLINTILSPTKILVESVVHELAKRASVANSRQALLYDQRVGQRPRDRAGYAPWLFLKKEPGTVNQFFLWHDHAVPSDYARLAADWDLPYHETDFADPNMGCGRSPR